MASLLKGQIVKHLAKFFKNLSPDSLNLSTLRGQCALHNLELNEDVLMEIFEFPVWLNLKKAVCNKAFIDVPWTKIKSQPVQLILDQVFIEIETCENFRQNTNYFNRLAKVNSGKYGLGDRVIDGLKVKIDSVEIHFTSSAFNAQLSLLQIVVESRLPNFKVVDNISQTKIKDTSRNQILIFKYIEWSSFRFEARSEAFNLSSPLRLITRNGSCKITLKKSLLDCSTISAKTIFKFDDLLWILTDATILSAIHLLMYITQLINKAPMNKKNVMESSPKNQPLLKNSILKETDVTKLFNQYNIIETSLHLIINGLQLHLSDDLNQSSFSSLKNGGGLHVVLQKLLIDIYPYHKAISSRNHWLWYTEPSLDRTEFINRHLDSFFNNIKKEDYSNLFSKNSDPEIDKKLKDLLSLTVLVRIGDYKINRVSTSNNDSKKDKKFSKDNEVLMKTGAIPKDLPALYLELNQYYYLEPGSNRLSTRLKSPASSIYLNIAPCFINFDIITFLWLNAFYSSIHNSLVQFASIIPQTETESDFHFLAEIVLPIININLKNFYLEEEYNSVNDYEELEIKCTKIILNNSIHQNQNCQRLDNLFSNLSNSKLLSQNLVYPWINEFDFKYCLDKFSKFLKTEIDNCLLGFHKSLFNLSFNSFWIDIKSINQATKTFLEPVELTTWINLDKNIEEGLNPDLNLFCCFSNALKIHIDHHSYLFIMRLAEKIQLFSEILKSDFKRIQSKDVKVINDVDNSLVLMTGFISHIEVFLKLETVSENNNEKKLISVCSKENISPSKISLNKDDDFSNKNDFFQSIEFNKDVSPIYSENDLSISNSNLEILSTDNLNSKTELSSPIFYSLANEEDAFSINSDFSYESEKIIYNLDGEDENDPFVFRKDDFESDFVEKAVELTEEISIKFDPNTKEEIFSKKNEKFISISYLKLVLKNLTFINQNKDFISTFLACVQEVNLNPELNVPYEQYEKDSLSNIHNFLPIDNKKEANIKIRFDANTNNTSEKDDKDLLSVIVQKLDLNELDKCFIDKLTDFLLDKEAIEVSKIKILLDDIRLSIKDNQLNTPVMKIKLKKLFIERNTKNEITIEPILIDNTTQLVKSHQDFINLILNKNSINHQSK